VWKLLNAVARLLCFKKSILIAKKPTAQRKINLEFLVLAFSCVIGSVVFDVFGE